MLFIDMSRDMTEPTALCQSRRLATLDVVTSALDNLVANNMVHGGRYNDEISVVSLSL